MKTRKNNKLQPTSFIKKTFKILSKNKHSYIISWSDDGLSFIIKDQQAFTKNILPQFFKHRNFASFNRQLNMYDFHKTKEESLEFTHPLFQRNNESLLVNIHRKIAEPPAFKQGTQELGQRLKKFQNQQNTMEDMLETLEQQYDKIVEQNQMLILELMQSKQKVKRIEKYISNIEERKRLDKRKDSYLIEDAPEVDEFLKLSPLSSEE